MLVTAPFDWLRLLWGVGLCSCLTLVAGNYTTKNGSWDAWL